MECRLRPLIIFPTLQPKIPLFRSFNALAGVDEGKWLIDDGFARSFRMYSHDYDKVEPGAKAAKRGVWQAVAEAHWDYRVRGGNTEIQGLLTSVVRSRATSINKAN